MKATAEQGLSCLPSDQPACCSRLGLSQPTMSFHPLLAGFKSVPAAHAYS
jgi:hypothetical protein